VTLVANKPSPQIIGASIIFTAQASGGVGIPEYQFMLLEPGATDYIVARAYSSASSANQWTWDTAGYGAGTYNVQVWARIEGSTLEYEALNEMPYVLEPLTDATQSSFVADPVSGIPANNITQSFLTATILDATGSPLPGREVTVAQISGPGTATIAPAFCGDGSTYPNGVSNTFGRACFVVAADTPGTYVFEAREIDSEPPVTVVQQASVTYDACVYSIEPTSRTHDYTGGSGTVSVITQADCPWQATSNNEPWLTVVSGNSGQGNGTVNYSVAENTDPFLRTGTLSCRSRRRTLR